MPTLRLFASAREAAGVARVDLEGATVAEVLDQARERYGERFTAVLAASRVWVKGQPADDDTPVSGFDVVAVLPPVSGGAPAAGTRPLHVVPALVSSSQPPLEVTARPQLPDLGSSTGRAPPPSPLRLVPQPVPTTDAAPRARLQADEVSDAVTDARAARAARWSAAASRGSGPALARSLQPEPGADPRRARPDADPDTEAQAKPEPQPAVPTPSTTKPGPALAVVPKTSRPHGRLGLAWAVVVTGATLLGPGWLAVWMAVAAFVAASQTAMVWLARKERPLPAFAAATAAALALAAVSGVRAMNAVVVVAVVATLVARLAAPTRAPSRDVALTLVIGIAVGLAAASPVLLRDLGIHAPLFLLAIVAAYDASAYLVGTGASAHWEGPAAGVAAIIPLTMFAGIVLVPPFHGFAPLLLGALGALLAPFGPVAASALLGDATASAPALRRLDSLLVLGPVWAWCAAAFLI